MILCQFDIKDRPIKWSVLFTLQVLIKWIWSVIPVTTIVASFLLTQFEINHLIFTELSFIAIKDSAIMQRAVFLMQENLDRS